MPSVALLSALLPRVPHTLRRLGVREIRLPSQTARQQRQQSICITESLRDCAWLCVLGCCPRWCTRATGFELIDSSVQVSECLSHLAGVSNFQMALTHFGIDARDQPLRANHHHPCMYACACGHSVHSFNCVGPNKRKQPLVIIYRFKVHFWEMRHTVKLTSEALYLLRYQYSALLLLLDTNSQPLSSIKPNVGVFGWLRPFEIASE